MAKNVASLPFVFKHVALMPDVHLGKGALVGSMIATKDAIMPAAVGVDVGCGMGAIKTPFIADQLEGKLKQIRLDIEATIPVGFNEFTDFKALRDDKFVGLALDEDNQSDLTQERLKAWVVQLKQFGL